LLKNKNIGIKMQSFTYDITSYEILMFSYLMYAVVLFSVSHAIKFLRDK